MVVFKSCLMAFGLLTLFYLIAKKNSGYNEDKHMLSYMTETLLYSVFVIFFLWIYIVVYKRFFEKREFYGLIFSSLGIIIGVLICVGGKIAKLLNRLNKVDEEEEKRRKTERKLIFLIVLASYIVGYFILGLVDYAATYLVLFVGDLIPVFMDFDSVIESLKRKYREGKMKLSNVSRQFWWVISYIFVSLAITIVFKSNYNSSFFGGILGTVINVIYIAVDAKWIEIKINKDKIKGSI